MPAATKKRASSLTGEEKARLVRQMTDALDDFDDALDDDTRAAIIGRFRNYSDRNALLVVMQREDATDVRGYNEWLKDGRQVMHGEKSIKILAPAGQADDKLNSDGTKSPGRRFFRLVSVFDVSQTEDKAVADAKRAQEAASAAETTYR
jgi:hypothetical protein